MRLATLIGAAHGFAIDRHHRVARQGSPKGSCEPAKGGAKGLGIKQTKHTAEGIVARHAVRQGHKTAQQCFLGPAKLRHLGAILGPAQNRRQRNKQDIAQFMADVVRTRLRQFRHKLSKSRYRHRSILAENDTSKNPIAESPQSINTPYAIPLRTGGRPGGGLTWKVSF